MSQVIYRDSFADSQGDERLYTYTSEASTLSHPVQSAIVEFSPSIGGPGYGLWLNEHPPTAGPYSAMNHWHANYPPQASYTTTTGHNSLPVPHTITMTQLAEHRAGNQTNPDDYHVPIALGSLQLGYYAPLAPEVPSDDLLGYAPIPDNVAGPSRDNSSPVHSGISDDEDLKRLARRYLDNRGAHVDQLLVQRRFPSGRKVLILLEIDDEM